MIRKLACAATVTVIAAGCSSVPQLPAVRGFQQPSGSTIVAEKSLGSEVAQGMPEGSASYVGASLDGSLIGFLTPDGTVHWYKTR